MMDTHDILALAAAIGGGKFALDRIGKVADVLLGEFAKDAYSAGKRYGKWGCQNFARVFIRTIELLDEGGTYPHEPLPPSFTIPFMDAASKTDDPTLAEMFARLLAQAASGEKMAEHSIFRETLSRMSGNDALMLQIVAQQIDLITKAPEASGKTVANAQIDGWSIALAAKRYKLDQPAIDFSLDNLKRFDLIRYQGETVDRNAIISIDRLGGQLIDLCLPPIPPQPV